MSYLFKGAPGEITSHIHVLRPNGSSSHAPMLKFAPGKFVELGSSHFRAHIKKAHRNDELFVVGAPGEIRTPDQLVRSQLLYPAELRAL